MANNNNDLIKYHNTPLISIFDNYGPSCFTRHMNLCKSLFTELLLRQEKNGVSKLNNPDLVLLWTRFQIGGVGNLNHLHILDELP